MSKQGGHDDVQKFEDELRDKLDESLRGPAPLLRTWQKRVLLAIGGLMLIGLAVGAVSVER